MPLQEGLKGGLNDPPVFKQRIIEASFQPGVSISWLALDNGINANLLFKWQQGKIKLPPSGSGGEPRLTPVTIDAELPSAPANEQQTSIPSVTQEIHNISCEITFRNASPLPLNGTVNENLLSLLVHVSDWLPVLLICETGVTALPQKLKTS